MRVTQTINYRNLSANLGAVNEKIDDLNRQVSSGKKLTRLKDSPSGSAELVALNEMASEIDQFSSNTSSGLFFLNSADSALNEVNNLTTSVYSSGSQAASGAANADERATIASEIRSLRNQILSIANSQVQGRYIFAGSKINSEPFTIANDAVTYNGDGDVNAIAIDNGMQVQQGVSGSEAFVPIFSAIQSLLSGLDGNNLSDIRAALGGFSSALSELSQARGQIGSSLSSLENVQTSLDSRKIEVIKQKSQIEDANLSQVVIELSQSQTTMNAIVSSSGSILSQRNLFDILG